MSALICHQLIIAGTYDGRFRSQHNTCNCILTSHDNNSLFPAHQSQTKYFRKTFRQMYLWPHQLQKTNDKNTTLSTAFEFLQESEGVAWGSPGERCTDSKLTCENPSWPWKEKLVFFPRMLEIDLANKIYCVLVSKRKQKQSQQVSVWLPTTFLKGKRVGVSRSSFSPSSNAIMGRPGLCSQRHYLFKKFKVFGQQMLSIFFSFSLLKWPRVHACFLHREVISRFQLASRHQKGSIWHSLSLSSTSFQKLDAQFPCVAFRVWDQSMLPRDYPSLCACVS